MKSSVAFIAALTGMLGNIITDTEALRVLTPAVAETVVSDMPYIVSWKGASPDDRFEIDLHYCGSYSFCFEEADECGFWVTNLCAEGDDACMNQDDLMSQVTLPEPVDGHSNSGYRVRIGKVGTETFRCSDEFYLMSSADASDQDGPTMEVVAPSSGALAVAGAVYTVEFDYDNGFGAQQGRFKIDLYHAEGTGDCGDWVSSVCDKPDVGCHDTEGDYDIVIPRDSEGGMYKIRVGLFGDDSVFACSASFEVVPETQGL
ncbi:EsV-1-163 [Ectocarpus siliculosus]|uniref:EsV-1-163 n=1 Tax=Ectocarpus siliculosus TaxID=2880 RepID=D7FN59_ECTSI|nr:EsV-1-163 [Ectocarpus siliculosus]|eukprot:CBJ30120.1 EsV-1-163 [Ectocarpus siliculosus]